MVLRAWVPPVEAGWLGYLSVCCARGAALEDPGGGLLWIEPLPCVPSTSPLCSVLPVLPPALLLTCPAHWRDFARGGRPSLSPCRGTPSAGSRILLGGLRARASALWHQGEAQQEGSCRQSPREGVLGLLLPLLLLPVPLLGIRRGQGRGRTLVWALLRARTFTWYLKVSFGTRPE